MQTQMGILPIEPDEPKHVTEVWNEVEKLIKDQQIQITNFKNTPVGITSECEYQISQWKYTAIYLSHLRLNSDCNKHW